MSNHNQRYQRAVQRRDALRSKLARLQGKLESARSRLGEVEERCRKKKIDPDQIDTLIERVERVLEERVSAIEQKMQEAEDQLSPYLEEVSAA
jgi:DNA repair exonuclease SbcCD ATPase subunit